MAFILPSNAFEGGSPALGALTGLAQGLASGIQARRQQDIAQQHVMLAQQEQALRQRAYEHGLQNEQDIRTWAQKLGEYKAWEMGGAGAQPLQGPPSPGAEIPAPGGVGPPQMGTPQPLGQGPPDLNARLAKVQELARTIPNPQAAEAFLAEVHDEELKRAATESRDQIASGIKNSILSGGFLAKQADGSVDESPRLAAQSILDQLNAASSEDPRALAEHADKAAEAIRGLSASVAQHNTQQHMRELLGKRMLQQIQDKWASGTSMADLAGAVSFYNDFTENPTLDAKDLQAAEKGFADEISGNAPYKRMAEQHKWENDLLRTENMRLNALLMESGRNQRSANRIQGASDLEDKKAKNRADLMNSIEGRKEAFERDENERKYGYWARTDSLRAAMSDPNWTRADKPTRARMVNDAEESIHPNLTLPSSNGLSLPPGAGATAGQAGTLQALKIRAKAEGWDEARARAELKKAGIDPDKPLPE